MNTNIFDPSSVANSRAYIQSKGRTKDAEKYIKALDTCTEKNLKRVKCYSEKKQSRRLVFGIIGIVFCALLIGSGLGIIGVPLAIFPIFAIVRRTEYKRIWNDLTVNGTVINPMLKYIPKRSKKTKDK